jgi:hypothetical protein
MRPEILDMCCGSRQFWFNPGDKRAVFCDIRCGEYPILYTSANQYSASEARDRFHVWLSAEGLIRK